MRPRALLVSSATPYPVVTNGCARLVDDYQSRMFPDFNVSFLSTRLDDWAPLGLCEPNPAGRDLTVDGVRATQAGLAGRDFAFVFFIGFKDTPLTRQLAASYPSFCLTDTYPHHDLPDGLFRGVLTHRAEVESADLLLVGGSYDDTVFRRERTREDLVLAVGRICPHKNQLDLVRGYREKVYEPYGLPLHLVGGIADAADTDYLRALEPYLDGEVVVASVDPASPTGASSWRSGPEIAALCNRARLFVSAAPQESFGMAMIEAMACGTTCVVNGDYWGFEPTELRPHVYGNVDGPCGPTLDVVAGALRDGIRIDGSDWASRYSLAALRPRLTRFIDERL